MDNQPPIPLDYKSPDPPEPPRERQTSATARFACGTGVGMLTMIVISALSGGIDIPIGPACGAVINVGFGAVAFFIANDVRGRFGTCPLRERNKFLTIILGLAPIGTMCLPLLFAQRDTADAALLALALLFLSSACCNWIAVSREPASLAAPSDGTPE